MKNFALFTTGFPAPGRGGHFARSIQDGDPRSEVDIIPPINVHSVSTVRALQALWHAFLLRFNAQTKRAIPRVLCRFEIYIFHVSLFNITLDVIPFLFANTSINFRSVPNALCLKFHSLVVCVTRYVFREKRFDTFLCLGFAVYFPLFLSLWAWTA